MTLRSKGDPVLFLSNPDGMDSQMRRQSLETLDALNREHLGRVGDPETLIRIALYEMAFRMKTTFGRLPLASSAEAGTRAIPSNTIRATKELRVEIMK